MDLSGLPEDIDPEWLRRQVTLIRTKVNEHRPARRFREFVPERQLPLARAADVFTYKYRREIARELKIKSLVLTYVYPLQEIRQAHDNQWDLSPRKAIMVRDMFARKTDEWILLGESYGYPSENRYTNGLMQYLNEHFFDTFGRKFMSEGLLPRADHLVELLRRHGMPKWSPDVMEAIVPLEFEQFPATYGPLSRDDDYHTSGPPFGLKTVCHARVGGLAVYR